MREMIPSVHGTRQITSNFLIFKRERGLYLIDNFPLFCYIIGMIRQSGQQFLQGNYSCTFIFSFAVMEVTYEKSSRYHGK